jgi:broad specificity phosphatase PhoE
VTTTPADGGPVELVFLRHAESEGERARRLATEQLPAGFHDRPPDSWRLTAAGRDQARRAGDRLRAAGRSGFDRHLTSPAVRARETAAALELDGARWQPESALRPRDWGPEVARMTPDRRAAWTAAATAEAAADPWQWRPPGGESLSMVRTRLADFLSGAAGVGRLVLVTHAELVVAARALLEPDPDRPPGPVGHVAATAYARRDPVTGAIAASLDWAWEADLADGPPPDWRPVRGGRKIADLVAPDARGREDGGRPVMT